MNRLRPATGWIHWYRSSTYRKIYVQNFLMTDVISVLGTVEAHFTFSLYLFGFTSKITCNTWIFYTSK